MSDNDRTDWFVSYIGKNGIRYRATFREVTLAEAERIIADAGGRDATITRMPFSK